MLVNLFDPSSYGKDVEDILALDGWGNRLMPLAGGDCVATARKALKGRAARQLFPGSAHPDAAFSGLWLYFSCYDESHTLSQDIGSAEGSFWHGILHRQEPDPGNAAYWFRRVGSHPTFPAIRDAAENLGTEGLFSVAGTWDPFAFIDFCEAARRKPGSPAESLALRIQLAEWQILFDWCARTRS